MADKVLNWSKGHLVWSGMSLAGLGVIHPAAATVAAAPVVTNAIFSKMMSNPTTAKLVVQALRTPSSAPAASFLNQALVAATRAAGDLATVPDK